ncbi:hypothetical protein ACEPPN_019236 [Leptodophora sp. 'Broadleaf-Isolate-01']
MLTLTSSAATEIPVVKTRPGANKRSTWFNSPSNVASMPILPTIRPISPISDAVATQAIGRTPSYNDLCASTNQHQSNADDEVPKKIGRQLSVASSNNHYADIHRELVELTGNSGLASPPNGQKESFFSHLRKRRVRRFPGRQSQTPISPESMDIEAQAGSGLWASNRSSIAVDPTCVPSPNQKVDTYDALSKALRNVQQKLEAGAAQGYETLDEENELLDEVLSSMQNDNRQSRRQSNSTLGVSNPYPPLRRQQAGMLYYFARALHKQHLRRLRQVISNRLRRLTIGLRMSGLLLLLRAFLRPRVAFRQAMDILSICKSYGGKGSQCIYFFVYPSSLRPLSQAATPYGDADNKDDLMRTTLHEAGAPFPVMTSFIARASSCESDFPCILPFVVTLHEMAEDN